MSSVSRRWTFPHTLFSSRICGQRNAYASCFAAIGFALRFYQLIQLSKIDGLNFAFALSRRLVPDEALEFLKPKIKNPALSAGPIRHTWTNSLVAQLMSTLGSVADLASQFVPRGPYNICPQGFALTMGKYTRSPQSVKHVKNLFRSPCGITKTVKIPAKMRELRQIGRASCRERV